MRYRGLVWGSLAIALLPMPAGAQQVSQSMNFVFTPFVLALSIIIPFKIATLAWAARRSAWSFFLPVVVASALTVLVTIPLTFGKYFDMPFHPDRYMTLILVSAAVLFCVAYCIDGVVILLMRLMFDPVDRLLLGATITNVVVFGLLALFGIGFWNLSREGYQMMIILADTVLTATYRIEWIMLSP